MDGHYTISQLARAADVPVSTLRYYERRKLLEPDGRSHGNYRVFGQPALHKLLFIRAAQANGFTLDDVAVLLSFCAGDRAPCREVQALIERRLADVSTRIGQLRHLQAVLETSLKACREGEVGGVCRVLERLDKVEAGPVRSGSRKKGRKSP